MGGQQGDGRRLWAEIQVSSGHSTYLNDRFRTQGRVGMQLLVRLMRMNGTASYLYCIYLYDYLFPLQHLTQCLHPVSI